MPDWSEDREKVLCRCGIISWTRISSEGDPPTFTLQDACPGCERRDNVQEIVSRETMVPKRIPENFQIGPLCFRCSKPIVDHALFDMKADSFFCKECRAVRDDPGLIPIIEADIAKRDKVLRRLIALNEALEGRLAEIRASQKK